MDDVKASIREFLSRFLRGHELGDDEDFFALGGVSSLVVMQLVMFVEKEFGVAVDDEDLDLDNFRSVNAIAGFVGRKQGTAARP